VINEAICSMETISKAKKMLEGVVENGTASIVKNSNYKVAGKTGTAQIANDKYGYKYKEKVSYQASFVGYFPADSPKYSFIVVVNAPSNNVYYGGSVAGPIFREVADKVYSTSIDIHKKIEQDTAKSKTFAPFVKGGYKDDVMLVAQKLSIPASSNPRAEWITVNPHSSKIEITPRKINEHLIPSVVGMSAADALFLLENKGMIVKVIGKGIVQRQSVEAGSKITKGSEIILELI